MPEAEDPADAVARALARLPLGTFRGRSLGHRWIVSRTRFGGGASEKIVARALGGDGYVSANLYRLSAGPRLRPCEMPGDDVVRFVLDLEPYR